MSHKNTALRNPITAWMEFYNQRELVNQMKKDGLIDGQLYSRESKKLHELHERALNRTKEC